jgi:protein-L-isoaspartate(D-aspartate) O-methyltransferase
MVRAADSTKQRRQLVGELERRELIRSDRVRNAFLAVPRELFVPEFAAREGIQAVYRDEAIPTKQGEYGVALSSSSQPAIMALMLEQLELAEGMRVLEIGAGTGYNAALLSLLVGRRGRVVSVDIDAQIAAEAHRTLSNLGYKIRIVHADGRAGFVKTAPYDRIIVTASSDAVPRAWFEQLADDGLLEVPLRLHGAGMQVIPVLRKTPPGFRSLHTLAGGFMPLRGADESGIPDPLREPRLNITETSVQGPESILQLSGDALETLSRPAKRRLLATALGEARKRRLGLRADTSALGLYLSLTLPKSRLVSSFPTFGIGVISRDGASLALVEVARPNGPKVEALMAYGGSEAEEFLLEKVRAWARRGRPTESDLRVTVTYEGHESRFRFRWPPMSSAGL